jgi:pimeloyl-ACP methyl ester carboxylesterase
VLLISSLSTEIIFWLVTLIALVLTVVFWHKLSPTKWHHITGRVSAIIFIQVFALASTGITINRAGEFYASWGDLFGSKNQLSKIAVAPNLLAQISAKDIAQARKTAGGSLIFREVIKGATSGISDVVYVVLPPKIAAQMEANPSSPSVGNDYQVVELFPGYPGVPQTWIGSMDGITTLENLENAGRVQNTIAIIPAINVAPGQDTECLNFVGGPQVETWITSDMHEFASKFLGVDSRPWSAFGYSTGGWCAAEVAIRHQDLYSSAVSLAGYFKPLFSIGVSKREKNFLLHEYDLVATLKKTPSKVRLMIIASEKDKFTHLAAEKFLIDAGSLIPIRYLPIPIGGHNTAVWKPFVPTAFEWINQQNKDVTATP